jgi:hypothetical protein
MGSSTNDSPVTRRAALAGLGAGGLGVALATTANRAAARDATPNAMAGHPLVGTWVLDPSPDIPTNAPAVAFFTTHGIFADPKFAFAGVWEPTGLTTAAYTFLFVIEEPDFSGYVAARGDIEVDATGDAWTNLGGAMTVAADGTVVATDPPSLSTARRLRVIAADALGTPMPEVATWEPAPPTDATPTS